MNNPYGIDVERMHAIDPGDLSWNESWLLSWIDRDGGPAGVFRIGVIPNQKRAMLWMFVHIDGAWYTVEESRLGYDDFDLSDSVAYDKWGLSFACRPDGPLTTGRFTFSGYPLIRSGPGAGSRIPMSIDLAYRDCADVHATGIGDDGDSTTYPHGRFEQSLEVTGTVTVGRTTHHVEGGAHRDKSWGPREWRQEFSMGDLQGNNRQLYFVGRRYPDLAMGYLREGDRNLQFMRVIDGQIDFDDEHRTIKQAHMVFEGADGKVDVRIKPIAPAIVFDIAHTVAVPESWLYWRTLVEASVSAWDEPVRGWFETSRYGHAEF